MIMPRKQPNRKRPSKPAPKKQATPKKLVGIGIPIAAEMAGGGRKTLGVIVSPNLEKLKELIKTVHCAKIEIHLPDVRAWEIQEIQDHDQAS